MSLIVLVDNLDGNTKYFGNELTYYPTLLFKRHFQETLQNSLKMSLRTILRYYLTDIFMRHSK